MNLIKRIILSFLFVFILSCVQNPNKGFKHKGYLGWLIDLSRTERLLPWPSVVIDSLLLSDYEETLGFMKRSGMNEITVWGLFTNSSWEPEIESTIDNERKLKVQDVILKAHQNGIKIMCGMGVYSWGFNKIIQQNPQLRCPCNNEVMDISKPEAWEWQKSVIDYIVDNYDFDGISMQSADRGGCNCGDQLEWSKMEYHAQLNQKAVDYIRSKKNDFIIGISGWGMDLGNPSDLASIIKMTENVDYLIDVGETAQSQGREYRKQLIEAISPCEYGTTGTPNVEPIQALPRNYYFIPTVKRTSQKLKELYEDGGRACETYYRTRGNPGDEVTIEVVAQILNDPGENIDDCLKEILSAIYQPVNKNALQELMNIFYEAEDAYFSYASGDKNIILLMPRSAIVPTSKYLTDMPATSLFAYESVILDLRGRSLLLLNDFENTKRFQVLVSCFDNILKEIKFLKTQQYN
jgi:hypothetical protein